MASTTGDTLDSNWAEEKVEAVSALEEPDTDDEGEGAPGSSSSTSSSSSSASSSASSSQTSQKKRARSAKEVKTRERLDALKAKKKKPRRNKGAGAWTTTNPEAHRDWFWAMFCEDQQEHMSTLELLEKPAPEQFVAVEPEQRISYDIAKTPALIRACLGKQAKAQLKETDLQVLVLCGSAKRAVAVIREAKKIGAPVAKLFAKHIKVEEQVEALGWPHPVGVGTPGRINTLFATGHLSTPKVVVIDMVANVKKMTMLDSADTRKDLMELVERYLLPGLRKGEIKVCIA